MEEALIQEGGHTYRKKAVLYVYSIQILVGEKQCEGQRKESRGDSVAADSLRCPV